MVIKDYSFMDKSDDFVFECTICGNDVCDQQPYYAILGQKICEDCIDDSREYAKKECD